MTPARAFLALWALTLPAAATAATPEKFAVPSGAEVWLQEVRSDRLPAMGLVRRYRFVMPALDALVPPVAPEDLMPDDLPLDAPHDPNEPLSAEDQAALDEGLSGLAIEEPSGGAPPQTDDGSDAPLPSQLEPPDAAPAVGGVPDEAAGDLAAIDGGDMALPAAPDSLMQDPAHKDIEWLCRNVALPEAIKQSPRPSQIIISLASAESEFGTFDPNLVQLFEGFALPRDRDDCIWEPM